MKKSNFSMAVFFAPSKWDNVKKKEKTNKQKQTIEMPKYLGKAGKLRALIYVSVK